MPHPFIPVPNTCRVELCYTQAGQKIQNTFHMKKSTSPTITDMEGLANEIVDWWVTNLKPLQTAYTVLRMVRVISLETESAPGVEYTAGLPDEGSHVGDDPLPNNVTIAVKLATGLRGRSYRGRIYHIGLHTGQVNSTNDTVDAATITNLINDYGALASVSVDWTFGVVSLYNNGAWRTTGVFTPITALSVDPSLDSQRRRLPGRGE